MFISFYEKILSVKKSIKRKTSNFYPLTSLCPQKIVAFVVFCLLFFVLLVGFLFVSVFMCTESFRKKINKFKIISVTSIDYNTDVYPYQSTYREFISTHLFVFMIICENLFFLWKSFFFLENLFFLWESLWVSSYLWSSVKISFFNSL